MNAEANYINTVGNSLYSLIEKLFPIHRSTTGEGVRNTLRCISDEMDVDLKIVEVPTGTKVFDWVVPKEWNIKDAYVKNSQGKKVIDYADSNLHVVNSSAPINAKMSLDELKKNLHTMPDKPLWIPYRYSHYNENWGFCVNYEHYESLVDGEYEVFIDSSFKEGSLTYGECLIEGDTKEEIIISAHICHPSLANDNLSGISIAAHLINFLKKQKNKYSYRIILVPSTIGAITWLAQNEDRLSNINCGLVLSCLGDAGHSTYKKSRRDTALIDRAMEHVLMHSDTGYEVRPFAPYGYDERQFNSPGINLPVGLFMRTPHDCYPQYHTSGDDLSLVKPEALADSYSKIVEALFIVENNGLYISQNQKGEAHLGRRGLYRQLSGQADQRLDELPVLWVMNYSDGQHDLMDIAEKSGIEFRRICKAVEALLAVGLLKSTVE